MRRLFIGYAVGVVLSSFALAQERSAPNSREFDFPHGSSVRLQLSSGDYVIRGGNADRILVTWQATDSADRQDLKKLKVRGDILGGVAKIHTEGPAKNLRFVIEIPARSDLFLRMRAGDVRITGIEGNKDIRMTAGDLKIDVAPASYSLVHASVTFGDLRAHALGVSKDGIKNSFDWNGAGKYTLHASLFAGDLILSEGRF